MKNRSKFVMGVLGALVVALGLTLSGCKKEDGDANRVFPPKLDERIEFHQAKDPAREEKIRVVQYAPDHVTKTGLRIEYKNNNTGEIVFRTTGPAAGKIESVTIRYPAKDGQTVGTVARQLRLDLDGRTYLDDKVWRQDGLLQYSAARVSDTKYVASDFREDGTTLQRKQEFVRIYSAWKLDLEERYRPDMTVESSVKRLDDGTVVTKKFADDNKIAVRSVLNRYESELLTEFYAADGTTLTKKTSQTSYDVTVTLYKDGKTTAETRFYNGFSNIAATFYDETGKRLYTQKWEAKLTGDVRMDGKIDPAKYKLTAIEYFDDWKTIKYVSFYADGKTPDSIRTHDAKASTWYYPVTVKKFRTDGTLSEVTESDGGGRVVKRETHTADENIREPIAPGETAMRPFENPPEMQKRSTPSYYWGY